LNTGGSEQYAKGGAGGQSCFSGSAGVRGSAAATNSGAGGAGGDINNAASPNFTGTGGGAGGCVEAIVPAPLATSYSYSIGTAGTAGGAGASGLAGTAGGSGVIIITEYYGTENMPLFKAGIIADNPEGVDIVRKARVTCSASSGITRSKSNWLTVGNISAGTCSLTVTPGSFSEDPVCTTAVIGGAVQTFNLVIGGLSPNGTSYGQFNGSAATSYVFDLVCVGSK
jgi:hypothetical protein